MEKTIDNNVDFKENFSVGLIRSGYIYLLAVVIVGNCVNKNKSYRNKVLLLLPT